MASPYFGLMGAAPDTARRFNLGGPDYLDTSGRLWTGYDNGTGIDYRALGVVTVPPGITSTDDDPLYYTVLISGTAIVLPVPAGNYEVVGYYCENFNSSPGRLSGLQDNLRNPLIATFDIYNAAGGRQIAYHTTATAYATAYASGLTLYLPEVAGNETISAIELTPLV